MTVTTWPTQKCLGSEDGGWFLIPNSQTGPELMTRCEIYPSGENLTPYSRLTWFLPGPSASMLHYLLFQKLLGCFHAYTHTCSSCHTHPAIFSFRLPLPPLNYTFDTALFLHSWELSAIKPLLKSCHHTLHLADWLFTSDRGCLNSLFWWVCLLLFGE